MASTLRLQWREARALDSVNGGQLYRPFLIDFNGVLQHYISRKSGIDFMAGAGWQNTRFSRFTGATSCLNSSSCYSNDNHLLVHAGVGLRYYPWSHFFVRPEAHFYHIVNNTDVFANSNVFRVGASIGYTFGHH